MVFKITDLRKQYGVFQPAETEADALAYEEERQKNHEEAVAKKVEELKALYNSNPTKYSKFKNFDEEDWKNYAETCLKANSATTAKYSFSSLPSVENDPELAKWAKFTYEEILQMESTGVLIPKEILAWAHTMQDSDVTAYEINDDPNATEETEETGTNSSNSELKELQKKAQTMSNKSENTQTEINQNFEAFQEVAKKAEQVKKEQETTKKDSLKQIEELTKEWEEISAKVKKGDKLSESEQKRYKELGGMLNGKDGELVTAIQASSDDLQDLMNSMNGLNTEIKNSIEIGDETVEIAKQLARYETGYDYTSKGSKNIVNMTVGEIKNVLEGSQGKDIAKEALENGNNLIEFSNTLSNQLMMNQYASLYDFAEVFTQTSTETITNTKEVLGDDFNKTTEELNEQIDALPDMTNAENDRYNLEQNGVGLVGQSLYFTKKSTGESFNSLISMIQLDATQKQSTKEQTQSQELTDKVTNEMTSKKEEIDILTEKKEKAEEAKEQSLAKLEDPTNIANAKNSPEKLDNNAIEEFTEKDQQKLDSLNDEMEAVGNTSQQKLFQSLSKVQGLNEILQNANLDGLSAIDYGQVTQQVGLQLMSTVPPTFFLWYIYMIGLMAYTSGLTAEALGEKNNELFEETDNVNNQNISSIGQNQLSIQEITKVEAVNLVSTAEGENNSSKAENNQTEAKDEIETTEKDENTNIEGKNETQNNINLNDDLEKNNTIARENSNEKDVKTTNISNNETTIINETLESQEENDTNIAEQTSINEVDQTGAANSPKTTDTEGTDNADNEEEMSTDSAQSSVDKMQTKTEEENDESIENKKDTEKTEKELEKEMKVLEKNMKNDQKELEKIAKESQKITQEKEQLAMEFEVLDAQNNEIMARQESAQKQQTSNSTGLITGQNDQQGGLLTGAVQQNTMAITGDDNSTLQSNQDRIVSISSRFTALDKKLNVNQTKVRNISSTSRKRYNKFEKLAKAKEKVIKQNQKVEQEKQSKVQKSLATVGIINNVFSITLSAGTILIAIGSAMPFGTGAPLVAAGSIMVKVGTYGMASCAILKSTILIANGNFEAAFTTMAMTAVQIATSMIPGAGAASGAVNAATATTTQAVAAGLNIVSAATDTVAQAQTLAGKEQSGWLNTVSQIAGAASVLTNVAGGFTNSKQVKLDSAGNAMKDASGKVLTDTTKSAFSQANTFGKTLQVAQAIGSTATTTAQISALIKQANGEDPGEFENILNTIGYSISAAASLGQIGMKIAEAASNKKELNNGEINNEKDNQTEKTKTEENEKDNTIPESLAAMMKNDELLPQINDPQNDLKIASENALAAISESNSNIDPEISDKIAAYDPETINNNIENTVIEKDEASLEPVISDELKEKIDAEIKKTPEIKTDEITGPENNTNITDKNNLKGEKIDRIMDITTNTLGAGSQIMQAVSAIGNLNTQSPDDANETVLKLSNMKKGKSLIRKIKKRRAALYGYTKSS